MSGTAPRRRRMLTWVALALLLALASAYGLYRGPYRAWTSLDRQDLTGLYAASRAWIDGGNPYDAATLTREAAGAGITIGPAWSLHPPTTFVLLAPLAASPWPIAEKAMVVGNLLLELAAVVMAMAVAGLHPRQPRGLLFVAFVIALAPFHTTFREGQLTIAAAALIVASLLAARHGRDVASGACIALAAALVPQMGVVFVALLALRRQWRALGSALTALGVLAVIGVAWMAMGGVDWLPTLLANLASSGVADPVGHDTQWLNVQPLLHLVLPDQAPATIQGLALAIGCGAGALLFLALRRRTDPEADLLRYAGFAMITLLTVYNRTYGATLLILPLAWAFMPARPRRLLPVAIAVSAACAVFLVPGSAVLDVVRLPGDLRWVAATPWWRLLQLHQVVALLVILAGLIAAARSEGAGPRRVC